MLTFRCGWIDWQFMARGTAWRNLMPTSLWSFWLLFWVFVIPESKGIWDKPQQGVSVETVGDGFSKSGLSMTHSSSSLGAKEKCLETLLYRAPTNEHKRSCSFYYHLQAPSWTMKERSCQLIFQLVRQSDKTSDLVGVVIFFFLLSSYFPIPQPTDAWPAFLSFFTIHEKKMDEEKENRGLWPRIYKVTISLCLPAGRLYLREKGHVSSTCNSTELQ